jgi:hypothetical protein
MSFAAITLCVASQRVFIVVVVYFVTDSVWKLLATPSYAMRKVQKNQEGLELNETHLLLVYVDNFNMLGGNIYVVKKKAETLLEASG